LRDLSPAKRRVLEAHYFEGLTLKEISQDPEFGGLSVPALKSQLLRTREELLKRCIELFGSVQEARNHLGLGSGF
jgi:DNA-directed RNA polymerase specialized sigma24 family protein